MSDIKKTGTVSPVMRDGKIVAISITKEELTSAYMTLSGEQDRNKAEKTLARETQKVLGPVSISKWLSEAARKQEARNDQEKD